MDYIFRQSNETLRAFHCRFTAREKHENEHDGEKKWYLSPAIKYIYIQIESAKK